MMHANEVSGGWGLMPAHITLLMTKYRDCISVLVLLLDNDVKSISAPKIDMNRLHLAIRLLEAEDDRDQLMWRHSLHWRVDPGPLNAANFLQSNASLQVGNRRITPYIQRRDHQGGLSCHSAGGCACILLHDPYLSSSLSIPDCEVNFTHLQCVLHEDQQTPRELWSTPKTH